MTNFYSHKSSWNFIHKINPVYDRHKQVDENARGTQAATKACNILKRSAAKIKIDTSNRIMQERELRGCTKVCNYFDRVIETGIERCQMKTVSLISRVPITHFHAIFFFPCR